MKTFSLARSLATRQQSKLLLRQHRAFPPINRLSPPNFCMPIQPFAARRWNTSLTVPYPDERKQQSFREPTYQIQFTCKPCGDRSKHFITKHGYHKGTVLVKCPTCSNRHVISDHLKIFMDEASTLEDILERAAGEGKNIGKLLKKGKLGIRQGEIVGREGDEDMEFWDDGTETIHESSQAKT